jgi:hypothetical protein
MRVGIHNRFKVSSRDLSHRDAQSSQPLKDIGSPSSSSTVALIARLGDIHLKQTVRRPLHHLFKAIPPHDEIALRRGLATGSVRASLTTRRRGIFAMVM